MKTVLIATDFSTAARNASMYGVELANALQAKVILFSAYHIPSPYPALNVSMSEYSIIKDTEQKLADEAQALLKNKKIEIEIVCEDGSPESAIIKIAKEKNADYIIAGMKGSGKNVRKLFGSTATDLLINTATPVIVVPEHAKFKPPVAIVFASDSNRQTASDAMDQLKDFTTSFGAKLYIVQVVKNADEEQFEVVSNEAIFGGSVTPENAIFEYPVDTDITHALNLFIEQHGVDVLVMMPHAHSWLDRLFQKSETKNMIYRTGIPLLILPERKMR